MRKFLYAKNQKQTNAVITGEAGALRWKKLRVSKNCDNVTYIGSREDDQWEESEI